MMRDIYTEQLKSLHDQLAEMGGLCEEVIAQAVKALTTGDLTLLESVHSADARIDKMERDIESMCIRLILKQQPVASDLRRVSSALKMISDMERIGDQASDIAEIARFIAGHDGLHTEDIGSMAVEAIKMVTGSVEAFIRDDLELARSVIAYDDVVDNWFNRIKTELIGIIAADSTQGEYCLDLLMIAKYLERIADHATNIGEWVEYSITGTRSKNGVIPQSRE